MRFGETFCLITSVYRGLCSNFAWLFWSFEALRLLDLLRRMGEAGGNYVFLSGKRESFGKEIHAQSFSSSFFSVQITGAEIFRVFVLCISVIFFLLRLTECRDLSFAIHNHCHSLRTSALNMTLISSTCFDFRLAPRLSWQTCFASDLMGGHFIARNILRKQSPQ